MKKFFFFKNIGTAEIKVVFGEGQYALGMALDQLVKKFNWKLDDITYLGSRDASNINFN